MSDEPRADRLVRYASGFDLLAAALKCYPRDMWHYRPAPGRWTIHEIVIHITDSEANSFARVRRLIAEPGQSVMAYDEAAWARAQDYHSRSPETALELFKWLRRSSFELIRDQPESVWTHTIHHPENGVMTMDDWLDVYARHVPDHIAQMAAVYQDWLTHGQP